MGTFSYCTPDTMGDLFSSCDYDHKSIYASSNPQCAKENGKCTTGCSGGDVCYGYGDSLINHYHCSTYGPYETVSCTNKEFCNPYSAGTKKCTLEQDEVDDFDGLSLKYTEKWCKKHVWTGSFDCVWDCALAAKKSGKCGSSGLIMWNEPQSSANHDGEQWGCACCGSSAVESGPGFDIYQYSSSFTGQSLRIVDGPRGYEEPAVEPVEFVLGPAALLQIVAILVLSLSLCGLVRMCARKCFKKQPVYKVVEVDTEMETADEKAKEDEDDKLL